MLRTFPGRSLKLLPRSIPAGSWSHNPGSQHIAPRASPNPQRGPDIPGPSAHPPPAPALGTANPNQSLPSAGPLPYQPEPPPTQTAIKRNRTRGYTSSPPIPSSSSSRSPSNTSLSSPSLVPSPLPTSSSSNSQGGQDSIVPGYPSHPSSPAPRRTARADAQVSSSGGQQGPDAAAVSKHESAAAGRTAAVPGSALLPSGQPGFSRRPGGTHARLRDGTVEQGTITESGGSDDGSGRSSWARNTPSAIVGTLANTNASTKASTKTSTKASTKAYSTTFGTTSRTTSGATASNIGKGRTHQYGHVTWPNDGVVSAASGSEGNASASSRGGANASTSSRTVGSSSAANRSSWKSGKKFRDQPQMWGEEELVGKYGAKIIRIPESPETEKRRPPAKVSQRQAAFQDVDDYDGGITGSQEAPASQGWLEGQYDQLQDDAFAPFPSIKQDDKRHLRKGQWEEVAGRLRAESRGQRVFRIYRYAVDDLRLLKVLEEAGMEGRVVVTDKIKNADVVLARDVKRTTKVDVSEAEAAARNARVPFIKLRALSAIRVMEAIAPLMGIPIPPHLIRKAQTASRYLPAVNPRLKALLSRLESRGIQPRSRSSSDSPPDLTWLDVDFPGDPPKMKSDMVSRRHPLLKGAKPGGRIRKRRLQKYLAEQSAPW